MSAGGGQKLFVSKLSFLGSRRDSKIAIAIELHTVFDESFILSINALNI